MSSSNGTSCFVELARLYNRKDEINEELKTINGEIRKVGVRVLEQFAELGGDSFTLKSEGRNVHLKRRTAIKVIGDRDQATQLLKELGLGDLVTESANLNTLRSHFRQVAEDMELDDAELQEALPEALRKHLELYTFYEAGCTRLPSKSSVAA